MGKWVTIVEKNTIAFQENTAIAKQMCATIDELVDELKKGRTDELKYRADVQAALTELLRRDAQ
jgi:hypothetical protein